jgi:hypothetical protein
MGNYKHPQSQLLWPSDDLKGVTHEHKPKNVTATPTHSGKCLFFKQKLNYRDQKCRFGKHMDPR